MIDPIEQAHPLRSGRGSAEDLLTLQRLAWSTLVVSATQKCPLSCRHCITRSGPDIAAPVLSPDLARIWAADLPDLAARGLRRISFTGGEPLLARAALELMSRAAAAADLETFVVSSGAWAVTPQVADRVLARLGPITRWDLGYDAFHAEHLAWRRFEWALEALGRHGHQVTVRICPPDDKARLSEMLEAITGALPPGGEIVLQPVRFLGRAAEAPPHALAPGLPRRPCVSTGLFLRADGSTGPCCSGLAYEPDTPHPFAYGQVRAPGDLLEAWRAWRADPLLRLLRLSGFAALGVALAEEEPDLVSGNWPQDPCEACVSLWGRAAVASTQALKIRVSHPGNMARLDALERALYDEVWAER